MSVVLETRVGTLPIERRFTQLAAVATGADSLYIRAKESMLAYFQDPTSSPLSEKEKAEMLSKLVGDMAIGMTGKLMDIAKEVTVEDRDAPYALAKVVADLTHIKLTDEKLAKDRELVLAQIDKLRSDIRKSNVDVNATIATIKSKTGYIVSETSSAVAIRDIDNSTDGMAVKQIANGIHTSLASSYRKDGPFKKTTGEYAIAPKADIAPEDRSLTEAQRDVAIRTEKGFDDNMLQHAVNSSANFMGLLYSSQNGDLLVSSSEPAGAIPKEYLHALRGLTSSLT